jgi:hypothetical protein
MEYSGNPVGAAGAKEMVTLTLPDGDADSILDRYEGELAEEPEEEEAEAAEEEAGEGRRSKAGSAAVSTCVTEVCGLREPLSNFSMLPTGVVE